MIKMNMEKAKRYIFGYSYYAHEDLTEEVRRAFTIAVDSLDMWDKVIKELDEKIDEQYVDKYDFCYQQGIEFSLELIKKYKKEIEK